VCVDFSCSEFFVFLCLIFFSVHSFVSRNLFVYFAVSVCFSSGDRCDAHGKSISPVRVHGPYLFCSSCAEFSVLLCLNFVFAQSFVSRNLLVYFAVCVCLSIGDCCDAHVKAISSVRVNGPYLYRCCVSFIGRIHIFVCFYVIQCVYLDRSINENHKLVTNKSQINKIRLCEM
jgi:hypothetical protein